MKLEDIEEAILKLSPEELAKFRLWFAEDVYKRQTYER